MILISLICVNVSFGMLNILKIKYLLLTGKNIRKNTTSKSKDPDTWKDGGQEDKATTEDELVG